MQRDPVYISLVQSPQGTTGISFHLTINGTTIENGFVGFIGVEPVDIDRFITAFNQGSYQTLTPAVSPFHLTVEKSPTGSRVSINARGELSLLLNQTASTLLINKFKKLLIDISPRYS